MTHLPPASFSELSPDTVLDALQSLSLYGDGRLLALNSYENRVYQVGMEGAAPVIVKFYRPSRWTDAAIREEHQFVDAGSAYQHRPVLDVMTFGDEPRAWLLAHDFIPPDLLDSWQSVTAQALESVRHCYDRAGDLRYLRLHGDCHVGNVLWTDDGPHFVDFDDSRSGPAIQDLWMLLSGERQERSAQLATLLAGYEDFFEFNPRELHLIEALRTLRLLHYSGWLARRWDDPAFPAAFPWFNTVRYWQDRILELREQVALMDEPPLWPL